MIIVKTKHYNLFDDFMFSYALDKKGKNMLGVCLLDKFCWTQQFGFELLK